jgi:hypothetical protein
VGNAAAPEANLKCGIDWETTMEKMAVMIGLGQLGRVFAGGLLKTGHGVVPVNRGDDPEAVAASAGPRPGHGLGRGKRSASPPGRPARRLA